MAKEITLDALGTLAVISHGLQFGNLRAASAIVTAGFPTPGQCWTLLAVTDGGINRGDIIYPLTKGYLTMDDPIMWHGLIPLGGTEYICLFGRSLVICTVVLSVKVSIQ